MIQNSILRSCAHNKKVLESVMVEESNCPFRDKFERFFVDTGATTAPGHPLNAIKHALYSAKGEFVRDRHALKD